MRILHLEVHIIIYLLLFIYPHRLSYSWVVTSNPEVFLLNDVICKLCNSYCDVSWKVVCLNDVSAQVPFPEALLIKLVLTLK